VYFPKRVLYVNVVISGASEQYHSYPKLAKAVYYRRIDGIVNENANAVRTVAKLHGVLVELGLKILKAQPVFSVEFIKCRFIIRLSIEKGYFHLGSFPEEGSPFWRSIAEKGHPNILYLILYKKTRYFSRLSLYYTAKYLFLIDKLKKE
jgi:hypothetical protein